MIVAGFLFPDDLHYLVEHQVWARVRPDGTAVVGITAMGAHWAGELYMCRPKGVGLDVAQGRSIGVVELAKSIVSVKSPVTGQITAINPRLAAEPDLVRTASYGDGWLAELTLTQFDLDCEALLYGADAMAPMERYAWLMREDE
jgi:glycine cleavage system H protein